MRLSRLENNLISIETVLMLALFLFCFTEFGNAQQQEKNTILQQNHIDKKIEQLKEQGILVGEEEAGGQRTPVSSGIDYNSLDEAFTVFEQDQMWNRNPNPNSPQNFTVYEQGQPAGNVNGDSLNGNPVNDFIVTDIARDEETSDLQDQTWKTAVFFGGNTSGDPDQIIDRKLVPAGDLNGDGYSDAIALETNLQNASTDNQAAVIYEGTENGLVPTNNQFFDGFTDGENAHVAFQDINDDGYDDVLSYFPNGDTEDVYIFWGEPVLSDVYFQIYSFGLPTGPRRLAVEDVDNDTLKEIVSLNGLNGDGQIQIAQIESYAKTDPSGSIGAEQQFGFTSFSGDADEQDLHLLDINGSGNPEIYISTGRRASKYIVEYDTTNSQYFTTTDEFFTGSLVPAGDLNNDGRQDFIQGDSTDSYKAHISYGPEDLTQEPALDVDLNGQSGILWNWNMAYNPYNGFGDLNGDGIDDVILRHFENANGDRIFGRRIIEGSESETFNSVFHTYPMENFRSVITATQNVGDLNGDGIDDLAMVLGDQQKVEIYYGAQTIPSTPDITINLDYLPSYIEHGDFNGDGDNEIGISGYNFIGSNETEIDIYSGDGTNVFSVDASDFQDADRPEVFGIFNIGDINNDGIDDFSTGSSGAYDSTETGMVYTNESYIFYGDANSISTTPDVTINHDDGTGSYLWAGERAVSLDDINGDGIDDFAISVPSITNADESMGQVQVFYGGASGDYASPDQVLTSNEPSNYFFGWAMSSGDFNGDGTTDLAAAGIYSSSGETEPARAVDIFYGGDNFGQQVDEDLIRPRFNLDLYEGTANLFNFYLYGTLKTLPDFTKNGRDELMFTSSFGDGSHAAIYTFSSSTNRPEIVLRAPNPGAGLGGPYNAAAGDFNDDEQLDLILTQMYDNNDANFSSRVYRYGLNDPIRIASVEDVPEDQGEWIRVSVDGYLMDAMSEEIYAFDSWAVRRMEEDSSWTSVATVKPYREGSKFVDVRVPKTQPTNVDTVDNTYHFKVIAYDADSSNAPNILAETAVDSGQAFDNIAPEAVSNVAVNDQDEKTIEWSPAEDNDVGKYEIYEVKNKDKLAEIGESPYTNTSFTLPDSLDGVRNFSVRTRDVNNNISPGSSVVNGVFSQVNQYDLHSGWNLIGLPVNADVDSIQAKLQNIAASGVFEYAGGYTEVSNMEAGKGYWVKFPSENITDLQGLPFTELTLELEEGWNLISGVGGDLPLPLVHDPDNILLAETLFSFEESYAASDTVRPGKGYWIRSAANGTVTFTHPKLQTSDNTAFQTESSLAKGREQIKDDFGKIVIENATSSQTLYFGSELSDQVDKRNYSLPPLPPDEVFDARFDDDMRLSEEDEVDIVLQKQKGAEIDVTLDTENLIKQASFTVKEFADGELLTEYTVNGDASFPLRYNETTALSLAPSGKTANGDEEIPEAFSLEQNYPNPFNPTTQIDYAIAEQAEVTLEVFNILGRKVATLVNSQKEPGNYQVTFDGSNLASGVYLYRLQAGNKVSTKKFILAK